MDIQIVKRHEEVLPANMSLLDKVGRMACICYRNEVNEKTDTKSLYSRIIKSCISRGHESILEHGIISLYIAPGSTEDGRYLRKIFLPDQKEEMVVGFRNLWEGCTTEASQKYISQFVDNTILDAVAQRTQPGTHPEPKPLDCLVGDIRTWRTVIKEISFLAINVNQPLFLLFGFRLLSEMMKVEPVFFEDLILQYNTFLKSEQFEKLLNNPSPYQVIKTVMKDREITVESLMAEFMKDPQTMFAAQADPKASVSVIVTTDRATTHQIVRHRRDVAYSQESQRYCNYNKKGLRIIPMTLEPSKYPMMMSSAEGKNDMVPMFSDTYLGTVSSKTAWYSKWLKGVQAAADTYEELLNAKMLITPENNDIEKATTIVIPPETARGVLPNDTATTIGITWMLPSGFSNYVYWRLEEHAQYTTRSMIARIIEQMYAMKHPFLTSLSCELVIRWLTMIRDQGLGSNVERINAMIEMHTKFRDMLAKQLKELQEKEKEAAKAAKK